MHCNNVVFGGNLTRDPETRHTQQGKQVCNFTIAVNDPGKKDAPPMFLKVVVWDKTAELCAQYLKKGQAALVTGSLGFEEYETKAGEKRKDAVVTAQRVSFGPKRDGAGDSEPRQPREQMEPPQSGNYAQTTRRQPAAASPRFSPDYTEDPDAGRGGTEDDLPF